MRFSWFPPKSINTSFTFSQNLLEIWSMALIGKPCLNSVMKQKNHIYLTPATVWFTHWTTELSPVSWVLHLIATKLLCDIGQAFSSLGAYPLCLQDRIVCSLFKWSWRPMDEKHDIKPCKSVNVWNAERQCKRESFQDGILLAFYILKELSFFFLFTHLFFYMQLSRKENKLSCNSSAKKCNM